MKSVGLRAGTPLLLAMGASLTFAAANATGQTVWTGHEFTFTKAPFANPTLPQNQDRITENVWITRGDLQGIYNAATEDGYTHFVSPADTEWATGSAADWESLTFAPWEEWADGAPPATVGVDAVVHLISDDIYLDIRFTQWSIGGAAGGGFAYVRALPPPVPFDSDGDGDVDLDDYAAMADCLEGPGVPVPDTCSTFDADLDDDVDLADFAGFAVQFKVSPE
jgi:hypothetical protein